MPWAGSFFGELLTGKPRTTDITSLTDCMIFEIGKGDLIPFIDEQADFIKNLSKIATSRIKERVDQEVAESAGNKNMKSGWMKNIFNVFGSK